MEMLGFGDFSYNVVYVQMGCGKFEQQFSYGIVGIVVILGKFVVDVVFYVSQNFVFLFFLDEFIIGFSIMLYKKNLDVFELFCVCCNSLQALLVQIS